MRWRWYNLRQEEDRIDRASFGGLEEIDRYPLHLGCSNRDGGASLSSYANDYRLVDNLHQDIESWHAYDINLLRIACQVLDRALSSNIKQRHRNEIWNQMEIWIFIWLQKDIKLDSS